MNEAKEQELREINSRLSTVIPLWIDGHTQASAFESHTRARQELDSGADEHVEQYIRIDEGKRAIGSARIARLLACIKACELRLTMNRKEPKQEVAELLRRKHELLESLLFS